MELVKTATMLSPEHIGKYSAEDRQKKLEEIFESGLEFDMPASFKVGLLICTCHDSLPTTLDMMDAWLDLVRPLPPGYKLTNLKSSLLQCLEGLKIASFLDRKPRIEPPPFPIAIHCLHTAILKPTTPLHHPTYVP
eukprot:6469273-Amphidinium_carterae.1